MLNKSIIDANLEIRGLFKENGYIDFDLIERGQENNNILIARLLLLGGY